MKFDKKYFQKFEHDQDGIKQYLHNAKRDYKIAQTDEYTEVRFTYSYQALIKAGIALIAFIGRVKVRSIPGHHIKVIDKMAEILNDESVALVGHVMRKKRNLDLYGGGEYISKKEADKHCFTVSLLMPRRLEKLVKLTR